MTSPVSTACLPQPDRVGLDAAETQLLSASDIPGQAFFDSFRDSTPSTADGAPDRIGSRDRTGIRRALNEK